jgi:hypothetical protein
MRTYQCILYYNMKIGVFSRYIYVSFMVLLGLLMLKMRCFYTASNSVLMTVKVKVSRYMPWRRMGGEEV